MSCYSWNHAEAEPVRHTWAPASSAVWCWLDGRREGSLKSSCGVGSTPEICLLGSKAPAPTGVDTISFIPHAHPLSNSKWDMPNMKSFPNWTSKSSLRYPCAAINQAKFPGKWAVIWWKVDRKGGGKAGAAMAIIPQCLIKVLRRKCFISLMEMWVEGKGQKKRPGVRSNSYIGRKSLLECNGIIKIYL